MYMLKHCRESFMWNKTRGVWPSTLFHVKHELDALTILRIKLLYDTATMAEHSGKQLAT